MPTKVVPKSTQWARENPERHRKYARDYYHRNKAERIRKSTEWRKTKNPARYAQLKERMRLKKYGLTRKEFQQLLSAQLGCCAICCGAFSGKPHIDHCHLTGMVRGLLCGSCNTALGHLGDDPWVATRAAEYLEQGLIWKHKK